MIRIGAVPAVLRVIGQLFGVSVLSVSPQEVPYDWEYQRAALRAHFNLPSLGDAAAYHGSLRLYFAA